MAVSSMRASDWPRFTGCPCSTYVCNTGPDISERSVADSCGVIVPEIAGPMRMSVVFAVTMPSGPTLTTSAVPPVAFGCRLRYC